jgi:5-methylcytosine-specific restriction protein A
MGNKTTEYRKHKKEEQFEWNRQTQFYLILNPYCKSCLKKGKVVPAEKVAHIKNPLGDYKLFWDRQNWQGVCLYHCNKKRS